MFTDAAHALARKQLPRMPIVWMLVLLSTLSVASGQPIRPSTASVPTATSQTEAIPAWMAWRAFHDSLKFYSGHSVAAVSQMLAQKFALTAVESETLLKAGESFLGSINRIDTDAKAQLLARYGRPPAPPRNPKRRAPVFPAGTIFRQQGKTLRDLAVESGLFAEVEGRKQVALTAHIDELGRAISPPTLVHISEWVQTEVRSRIKTSAGGVPVPGIIDSSANGASPSKTRPDTAAGR